MSKVTDASYEINDPGWIWEQGAARSNLDAHTGVWSGGILKSAVHIGFAGSRREDLVLDVGELHHVELWRKGFFADGPVEILADPGSGSMVSLGEFEEIIGVPGWREIERRYASD